jgi:hypothetical protein
MKNNKIYNYHLLKNPFPFPCWIDLEKLGRGIYSPYFLGKDISKILLYQIELKVKD